jgi:hypothetical protein
MFIKNVKSILFIFFTFEIIIIALCIVSIAYGNFKWLFYEMNGKHYYLPTEITTYPTYCSGLYFSFRFPCDFLVCFLIQNKFHYNFLRIFNKLNNLFYLINYKTAIVRSQNVLFFVLCFLNKIKLFIYLCNTWNSV